MKKKICVIIGIILIAIIVEPNDGEEVRKSADKIFIGLDESNDMLYMVGTNLKLEVNKTIA